MVAMLLIASCTKPTETTTITPPVDSLITEWAKSWNSHDSLGVRNMFEADGILVDDNIVARSHDEMMAKWIRPNINAVNNLTAEKIQEWTTADRAGFTGFYELDVIVNDSLIAHPKGMFTVNWRKNDNGSWKITNAHINSLH